MAALSVGRTTAIAFLTILLIVIFQAWYDVYKTVLYNFIGTEEPSDSQVLFSTIFLTFIFFVFIKIGLQADLEPIFLNQGLAK